MIRRKAIFSTGSAALVLAATAPVASVWADTPAPGDVSAQVDTLKAQVAELKAANQQMQQQVNSLTNANDQAWLDERRAEEVKALVKEVLSDADTRASLAESEVTAGHNNKGFFLASEDGTFFLNIWGQLQARYIVDSHHGPNPAGTANSAFVDTHEDGFQLRRAKIGFEGFVGNPKIDYRILLSADRDLGVINLEDAWLRYSVMDNLKIFAGQFQDVIGHEQMESSKRMMAVERTAVVNILLGGDDFTQGAGAEWTVCDYVKLSGTVNDGINSGLAGPVPTGGTGFQNTGNDFNHDSTDIAFSGRVDAKLLGDWENAGSPVGNAPEIESWSDTPTTLLLGAGVHYELGSSNDRQTTATLASTGPYDDFILWTVDGMLKTNGLGIAGAFYGEHIDAASGNPASRGNENNWAATVQVAYQVIPDKLEPYIQYEWMQVDESIPANDHHLNILTGGANYFFKKHALKLTGDVSYLFNNLNSGNALNAGLTGVGLTPDIAGKDGQIVGRVQVQLLF